MFACCGRPAAASFCDPFAYIVANYARETIAKICSLGAALATAPISQAGSQAYPCQPSNDYAAHSRKEALRHAH